MDIVDDTEGMATLPPTATSCALCKRQPIAISTLRSPTYNVEKPKTSTLMQKTPKKLLLFHGVRCQQLGRRKMFIEGGAAAGFVWTLLNGGLAAEAKEIQVGSYLPPASSNSGFVQFRATNKDTPALRAGNVEPYQFILPPTWKQVRVANILSGNYCQPKCAEPWVEAKFEDEKQGTLQVVASPLIRLTNKPNARIEEIAAPEKLIASLGPFVTGNSYDPDELVESNVEKHGDQIYYTYRLETPYALTGTHNLAKATAKGNTVVLFVVSANDKQWPNSEKILQTIIDSFQV